MIYLVKLLCPSCNMKIELGEEHFNNTLDCPNCGTMFTLPDPNQLKEENSRLSKQIEELKNKQKKSTNTISMKRKMGTLKVGKVDLLAEDEESPLEKLESDNKKLMQETEVLNGKLKGLQSANFTLNAELTTLKDKGNEADKGIEKVIELQKEITEKDQLIEILEKKKKKLEDKLTKFNDLTLKIQSLAAERTLAGTTNSEPVLRKKTGDTLDAGDNMAETLAGESDNSPKTVDPMAVTDVAPENLPVKENIENTIKALEELDDAPLDDTLELSITAIQEVTSDGTVKLPVGKANCTSCKSDISPLANFCTICGASQ